MPNPVLNEQALRAAANNWAPPNPATDCFPPINDGPVSSWKSKSAMTINGTISATATLFVILLASAVVGWMMVGKPEIVEIDGLLYEQSKIPMLAWGGLIVGFGLTILLRFKPLLAKFIAPVYAVAEGIFVGAISRGYENYQDGIVVQAVGVTLAVVAVMLVLYRTGVIKVTNRFRKIVTAATMGVMVFYGISFLVRLFAGAGSVSFLSSPSLLGIGFSVLVAGLAAFNLALDFDFIERGAKARLDKNFEWYAAFGLLVTVIWLYLEILRLLSKLNRR